MSEDKPREVPKEGSNHIDHEDGQQRSSISDVISNPYPQRGVDPKSDDVEPADGDNAVPQPYTSDREPQE